MSKRELRDLVIEDASDLEDLDEADVRWLLERDRIPNDLVEEAGVRLNDLFEDNIPMEQRGNTGDVRTVSTDELEKELERRRNAEQENPNREVTGNPSFADDDDDEDDGDEDDDDYASWSNERLRTEIARRNQDRADDDQLSTSGKKADLVAELERDDEEGD